MNISRSYFINKKYVKQEVKTNMETILYYLNNIEILKDRIKNNNYESEDFPNKRSDKFVIEILLEIIKEKSEIFYKTTNIYHYG